MITRTIIKDTFGPELLVRVYDPHLGMEGFLAVDNTALGPGKGGIRMTAEVTEGEIWHLARTMTWKNALAGIPFGGAKVGIVWPGGDIKKKKAFVQSFARALAPFMPSRYIAGPDVNTGEREMQWFVEATGKWNTATGKPAKLCAKGAGQRRAKCGIPHEFGSTGFGVAHAARVAVELTGLQMKGARVAIHGFGNVGTFARTHLEKMGAVVVALADRKGAIFCEKGFDDKALARLTRDKNPLSEYQGAGIEKIESDAFWQIPVDILIPASVTDVIHEKNKGAIKTRIIVEGGNIPMSEKIEDEFSQKGIMVVPDFVANAGGVISSYAEYKGYTREKMFKLVEEKVSSATRTVLEGALQKNKPPRTVAMALARARVEAAMVKRAHTF